MYVLLLGFWVLLNGKITLEILLFGLVIAAAVYFFMCRFMDYSFHKDLLLAISTGKLLLYFLVLIREIAIANWNVLKLVYSPEYVPDPAIVRFKADLRSGFAKVLLANSITLTPGTITVSVTGNEFCVHCLDVSYAEGIEESVFVRQLRRMEEDWYPQDAKAKSEKEDN